MASAFELDDKVGTVTKPTGAITVTETTKEAGNATSGTITVKGGTTVSVTENMAGAKAA